MHMHITLIMSFRYNYSCVVLVNANFLNVLIVLLEYISIFFSVSGKHLKNNDNNLGGAIPVLYHSILQYFILSIAIVTN